MSSFSSLKRLMILVDHANPTDNSTLNKMKIHKGTVALDSRLDYYIDTNENCLNLTSKKREIKDILELLAIKENNKKIKI